jgi:hypothetical protein
VLPIFPSNIVAGLGLKHFWANFKLCVTDLNINGVAPADVQTTHGLGSDATARLGKWRQIGFPCLSTD